ncbi:hypothetical protein V3481_017380 [Fusarium oxysporum f. sp. vasinfectum]
MAEFTQQGLQPTFKRPYEEYLTDSTETQLLRDVETQRQEPPFAIYPEFQVSDRNMPALGTAAWDGQPQALSYEFNNVPLVHNPFIGEIPYNNYGGYEHNIQQQFLSPTAFVTPTYIFPNVPIAPIHGCPYQYQNAIHQGNGWINPQHHQGFNAVVHGFDTSSHPQCPPNPNLICFGMIKGLSARCGHSSKQSLSEFSVKLSDAENFISSDDVSLEGKVSHEFTYLTNALLSQSEIDLEITCSTLEKSLKSTTQIQVNRISRYPTQCCLDVIIYGPADLFQDVGSFFEEYDLYLQDPVNCKRNVRYCNPHRLPVDPSAVKYTFDLGNPTAQLTTGIDIDDRSELFDGLFSQPDLAEAAQPRSIRTSLQPHQKQALTFLLQRECGWAWDGCRADIWEARDNGHESYFYNTVSGAVQVEQPPQFYGGIVADPMGLGKTLCMIALIACDVRAEDSEPSLLPGVDIEVSSDKTLIVVPAPLMGSWEDQLQRFFTPTAGE